MATIASAADDRLSAPGSQMPHEGSEGFAADVVLDPFSI